MSNKPTIVTNWDSMPPEVYAEGEIYSTRVLAANYRKLEEESASQAQEIRDLNHHNDELTQSLQDCEQETTSLKAHVNDFIKYTSSITVRLTPYGYDLEWVGKNPARSTPAQSLAAHDAAIEEEVIEQCRKIADNMWWQEYERDVDGNSEIYHGDVGDAIRNMPRNYEEREGG